MLNNEPCDIEQSHIVKLSYFSYFNQLLFDERRTQENVSR